MAKAKAKTGRKARGKKPTQEKVSRKPAEMNAIRDKVTAMVRGSAVNMVKTTMGEVDKGHYAAMKYLFELIGLFPGEVEADLVGDDSMAKTLLRRLRIPEEAVEETQVTRDAEAVEPFAEADAVK